MMILLCFGLLQAEETIEAPVLFPSLNELLQLPKSVTMELSYVAEPVFAPSSSLLNYAHGLEYTLQMSTGFSHEEASSWKEIDHWIATFDVQQYYDTGDIATDIGVVNAPQEIFNPAGFYLGELSLTRNPGAGWLYAKIGLLSIDADFLSPEITGFYTHAAFNNQYNVSMEIFPISPMNAFGAVVGGEPIDNVMLKVGAYQLSSIQSDFERRGWDWTTTYEDGLVEFVQLQGQFGEVEESLNVCPPNDHTFSRHAKNCGDQDHVINELPAASWQLGSFISQSETDKETLVRNPNNGFYANLTLPVPLSIGVGHRFWVSGAYGLHPEKNPVPVWVGTGWMSQGLLVNRPLDLLLLGASYSGFYNPENSTMSELLVEMEYSMVLTDTIIVQPNVQYYLDTILDTNPLVVGIGFHLGL